MKFQQTASGMQFFEAFIEDMGNIVGISLGHAQRWDHSEDIAIEASLADQNLSIFGHFIEFCCQFRCWLFGLLVLNQLDTHHQTMSSDVSNRIFIIFISNLLQLLSQMSTNYFSILMELFLLNNVDHLHADSALNWSTTKSIEMDFLNYVHHLFPSCYGSHRESVSNTFCHRDDIWLGAHLLEAPHILANSTKTCLNLVRNTQPTISSDKFINSWQISWRQWVSSNNSLNWLSNKASHLATRGTLDHLLSFPHILIHTFQISTIFRRECNFLSLIPSDNWMIPSMHIGNTLRTTNQPVISIPQTDNLVTVCVQPAQQQGKIVSLGTRINNEHVVISLSEKFTQFLTIVSLILLQENG